MKRYIEKLENGFNIWLYENNKYYCVATLFYNDPMCVNQWQVFNINKTVTYSETEIEDEIESTLKEIPNGKYQQLISIKQDFYRVYEFLFDIYHFS